MMYHFITLQDRTEVTFSHIIQENNIKVIQVHFERPTINGFDFARCVLPEYKWIKRYGFSEEELNKFEELLHRNIDFIYKESTNMKKYEEL